MAGKRDECVLPPFDPDAICPKCGHTDVNVVYEANTSHWHCPIGEALSTSYGPEHFTRTCHRCRYRWEEAVLSVAQHG